MITEHEMPKNAEDPRKVTHHHGSFTGPARIGCTGPDRELSQDHLSSLDSKNVIGQVAATAAPMMNAQELTKNLVVSPRVSHHHRSFTGAPSLGCALPNRHMLPNMESSFESVMPYDEGQFDVNLPQDSPSKVNMSSPTATANGSNNIGTSISCGNTSKLPAVVLPTTRIAVPKSQSGASSGPQSAFSATEETAPLEIEIVKRYVAASLLVSLIKSLIPFRHQRRRATRAILDNRTSLAIAAPPGFLVSHQPAFIQQQP
jgi:hypothetical protein